MRQFSIRGLPHQVVLLSAGNHIWQARNYYGKHDRSVEQRPVICPDDALSWKTFFGRAGEFCREIGNGNHDQFSATVAFDNHSPIFEFGGQSTADATHILAALSVGRFLHP